MPCVLIVSNQQNARSAIAEDVEEIGIEAITTDDLSRALDILETRHPSLVLLDLIDRTLGAESLWRQQMRQAPKDLPFLLLIPEEGIRNFDFPPQTKDFILVPFVRAELHARLRLALGSLLSTQASNVIERGQLRIDLDRYKVSIANQPVELTLKEFELLRFLAEHPGKVHTRESLMTRVWGYDYFGGTRTVDVHIRRIRAKLEPHADEYIDTVRGVGYCFRD
ncbi:MAG TPA: response regulator transcription factor [Candidatus Latescibacteria bacterium]|nr:response regulator transcription factor [Candidatus Latescibacterota bacterium]HRU23732.1 response regulator transcription factor [Candidatus Latescibacterota bacterium]